MTGGLMNIKSYGNENIILNGNPKKTYFKVTYNKHTNFGLQRFRINFNGTKTLNSTSDTILNFKIPRYADLLYDSYFVVNLPNIWSPFYFKKDLNKNNTYLIPYEFKWIREIGSTMIKTIEIKSGGSVISKYSGEYLSCLVERDFNEDKKKLWNRMTGNISELYDPANSNGNINVYPNCFNTGTTNMEPSIKGRQLYIPLNSIFGDSSKMALPLIALQYQEIEITITLRPLYDLFTINNIDDETLGENKFNSYRIRPNPNVQHQQLWRFLREPLTEEEEKKIPPPPDGVGPNWVSDPHIISTYIFLDNDERRYFAQTEHRYLIKECREYDFLGIHGSKTVEVESKNVISNYMWRFRRNDCKLRNEWNNYSNWAYKDVCPLPLKYLDNSLGKNYTYPNSFFITDTVSNFQHTMKNILLDLGIVIGGSYRENVMNEGVFNYVEKYNRTTGNARDGLYCYNFCLNSNRREYQPSGGMNVNKFKNVLFEFNTIEPPMKENNVTVDFTCDADGNAYGFRKNTNDIVNYSFDLKIFEERYNVLIIQGGKLGLLNAK